jgi:MerR family transcriptional regulator/heat shock protein HspR
MTMNAPPENDPNDLPLFEPDTEATYTLEIVAELTGVSSQTILHYQEHGLISPLADSESGAHYFNDDALRTLRRIEHLRTHCGMNETGIKLMLGLLDEVERLRADLRSWR